ncbi:protein kinase [Pendulispora rubella]|uniref:Protein kinase n=2 Tax=Pendulispora rubella TaxID=2741070 RepID=A0ABZ2LD60_9BACT
MGSVWEATLLSLDIPCAVKFIDSEFVGHAETQARFEREAKAAAQLRSPHVVQVLDHGVCQGRPYIAMELLVGEDLGKRLKARGRLSPSEVVPIVEQVSRALAKAHAAGIVHRDLKPDNIFLVRDDDREIVKVLDFGIAKSVDESREGLTRVGALLGTPHYMSPEQAQGSKDVDHRSDLWSLAVIIFRCLTGRFPFAGKGLGEILVQILKDDIPIPSQAAPDLPRAFDDWWVRGVARDPTLRFQSARELTDGLSMALGLNALSRVPEPAESQPALFPERRPAKGGTAVMPASEMPRVPTMHTGHGGHGGQARAGTQPLAAVQQTPSMIVHAGAPNMPGPNMTGPRPTEPSMGGHLSASMGGQIAGPMAGSMSGYGPMPAAAGGTYGPPPYQGGQQPYGQPYAAGQAYPQQNLQQNTTAPTTAPAIPTAANGPREPRDKGMLATKIIGILLTVIAVVLGIVVIVAYASKDPVIGRPPSVHRTDDLPRRSSPSVILSTGPVPIQPPPTPTVDASTASGKPVPKK